MDLTAHFNDFLANWNLPDVFELKSVENNLSEVKKDETKSIFTVEEYVILSKDGIHALHNHMLECAMKKVHTIIPPHRQDVVGVANVNCLALRNPFATCSALVAAFPETILSLTELHNFELLIPKFITPIGEYEKFMGHANLYVIPSIVQAGSPANGWPVLHWESLIVSSPDPNIELLNEVMTFILYDDIPVGIDINSVRFKNALAYFSLRAGHRFELLLQPSNYQKGVECVYITLIRSVQYLCCLNVDPDLDWIHTNGKRFVGALGFIVQTGIRNNLRLRLPNPLLSVANFELRATNLPLSAKNNKNNLSIYLVQKYSR